MTNGVLMSVPGDALFALQVSPTFEMRKTRIISNLGSRPYPFSSILKGWPARNGASGVRTGLREVRPARENRVSCNMLHARRGLIVYTYLAQIRFRFPSNLSRKCNL